MGHYPNAGGTTPDWINVAALGADLTGHLDSTGAFTTAVNQALVSGGTVYIPQGTYKQTGLVTASMSANAPVSVVGDGWGLTTINLATATAGWQILCPNLFTGGNLLDPTCSGGYFGGAGITLNASGHSGTGCVGLQYGDLYQWNINVQANNFTASNDVGVHMLNQWFWTEQQKLRVQAAECQTPVLFDRVPAGGSVDCTGSLDGSDVDIVLNLSAANAGFNGVIFQNGTYMDGGALNLRGNMQSSASSLGNTALLTLTGSAPVGAIDNPRFSHLESVHFRCAAECEGSGAHSPATVFFGTPNTSRDATSGNIINNCYGQMNWQANTANWANTNSAAAWTYWGPVVNDTPNSNILPFANFIGGAFTNSMSVNLLVSSLTGGGRIAQGSGAPTHPNGGNPVAGDIFFRTDTPSTANQRVYICTVGGASPTWVGIV